jgi:hypothetical protein
MRSLKMQRMLPVQCSILWTQAVLVSFLGLKRIKID